MAHSSLIFLSHEHADHIGGVTTYPNLAASLAATKPTREQIENPAAMLPGKFPDHLLDGRVPLDYRQYVAAAPATVLIKSPATLPVVSWSMFKLLTVRSFSS